MCCKHSCHIGHVLLLSFPHRVASHIGHPGLQINVVGKLATNLKLTLLIKNKDFYGDAHCTEVDFFGYAHPGYALATRFWQRIKNDVLIAHPTDSTRSDKRAWLRCSTLRCCTGLRCIELSLFHNASFHVPFLFQC